ncbi:ADP-ribose pyrophosphatase [Caloramator fervidus]|uniref:ADP-ribose pyrophosphatase n=1 Tax=Caloramator fervidus TaxID=29344 RepID=A0A1H5V5V5_9CLOT|nr:NUDIX hydrolase [Caloramator fervidus]SEF82699.1 ADP-ribose pyrophosphatase [Caloramator fervidus]
MNLYEKTISSEQKYNGKIIKVRQDFVLLPNGKQTTREVVEHNGGVGIVAVTNEKNIILIRQFRKPAEEVLIEIPAGKLEKGEEPEKCAARELEEETGKVPKSLKLLTKFYPSPGYSSEVLYIYYSDDLQDGKVNLDEGENVEVFEVSIDKALEMIKEGEIKDAKTIIGILLAKNYI